MPPIPRCMALPASMLLLGLGLAATVPRAVAAVPEPLWETGGFSTPESVVFDRRRGVFYVSNIGTRGADAIPDDGFISRLDADGTLLDLEWITGLHNPKGLALANGRSDVTAELFTACGNCGGQPSVILTVPGSEWPDEIVVVGGHLDSISNSGSGNAMNAPGADDDASVSSRRPPMRLHSTSIDLATSTL